MKIEYKPLKSMLAKHAQNQAKIDTAVELMLELEIAELGYLIKAYRAVTGKHSTVLVDKHFEGSIISNEHETLKAVSPQHLQTVDKPTEVAGDDDFDDFSTSELQKPAVAKTDDFDDFEEL